jgi:hypothetical protein
MEGNGMFTSNVKISGGVGKWLDGLGALIGKRKGKDAKTDAAAAIARPEPTSEGQRALYQAMGWKENGWE